MLSAVGTKRPLWEKLTAILTGQYGARSEIKFYFSSKYGWVLRFLKGGRPIATLYPGHETFRLQIVIGPKRKAEALAMPVGRRMHQALEDSCRYPEGPGINWPVASPGDLDELLKLLALKLKPV